MPGRGVTQVVVAVGAMVLSGHGIYNISDEQKGLISDTIQLIGDNTHVLWQKYTTAEAAPTPQPRDITEVREKEFNFHSDSGPVTVLNTTKFSRLAERKSCDLYEDTPLATLHQVMDAIGAENKLTENQVKLMKLSLSGGRTVKATEVFEHGREGRYLLVKYTAGRTPQGNYDFLVANYGYSWTLDVMSLEEAQEALRTGHRLEGVGLELLPEEARQDLLAFLRLQTQHSISLAEKEQQTEYFRSLSQRSLAYLCPKLS